MIRLAIAGAAGRMGQQILTAVRDDPRFELVAALERADHPSIGQGVPGTAKEQSHAGALLTEQWHAERADHPSIGQGVPGAAKEQSDAGALLTEQWHAGGAVRYAPDLDAEADVLVDFSLAQGTQQWLDRCVSRRVAMVICSTGHDDQGLARIKAASAAIPIVHAANTSLGINLLMDAAKRLAERLGPSYDVAIVETHHRHKIDAPSGTAAAFRQAIQSTGRPSEKIPVHSVRIGEVFGEHEIHFSAGGETITLVHRAQSRAVFAVGALIAAAWVADRKPGYYTMRDVIHSA